jgi:hypothetical protein
MADLSAERNHIPAQQKHVYGMIRQYNRACTGTTWLKDTYSKKALNSFFSNNNTNSIRCSLELAHLHSLFDHLIKKKLKWNWAKFDSKKNSGKSRDLRGNTKNRWSSPSKSSCSLWHISSENNQVNHFNFQRKKYEYNIIEVLFFQGKSLNRLASGNSKFSKLRNFQAYE